MRELFLISAVVVAASMLFLVYKMYKNNVYYNNEFNRIEKQMKELTTSMIQINKVNSEINKQNTDPGIYSNLKSEYENYTKKFQTDYQFNEDNQELSSELKDEINKLPHQDSPHQEESLHQVDPSHQEDSLHQEDSQKEIFIEDTILNENVNVTMENGDDILGDDIKEQISNYLNSQEETQNKEISTDEIPSYGENFESNIELSPLDEIDQLEEISMTNPDEVVGAGLVVEQLDTKSENETELVLATDENGTENGTVDGNPIIEENKLESELNEDQKIKLKTYNNYSLESLEKLSIKELQNIARNNKLKIKGRKDELLERVKTLYNLNQNLY